MKKAIDARPHFSVGEIAFVNEDYWGLFNNPDFSFDEAGEIPKDSYVVIAGEPKNQYRSSGRCYPVITVIGFGWCTEKALTKVSG